jgi:type I restriction enzyme S subunit
MEKLKNIPSLRFPEFHDSLEKSIIGKVANLTTGNKDTQNKIEDGEFPFFVRSQTIERINSYSFDGEAILTSGDGVGVGKNFHYINGKFDYHQRVYCLSGFNKNIIGKFVFYYFSENFNRRIMRMSAKNSVDSVRRDMIFEMEINIPSIKEQQKISSFLTTIDEKLTSLMQKKTLLEQYKKGVIQKIFSKELRFKNDNGNDYPNWEEKKLGDCLDYIQPTKYLVSSTEYDNTYLTPVLTAGKTFILGYTNETNGIFENNLPVIIFDDFTTATQFVDFPFKAKSSAMKILIANEGINIKFIYEAMEVMNYEVGGHERHWISKFAPLDIRVPNHEEQTKIANFLSAIDDKINQCEAQIEKTEVWKKGLLQKMFC